MSSAAEDMTEGLALHGAGRFGDAAERFGRIVAADPGNARVLHLLGLCRLAQGRPAEGVDLLRRCLEARPDFPEALTNLGRGLCALDRVEEAIGAHERALRLDPGMAEAHGNLGNALKALHRLDEALAAYGRALALRPDSADLRYNVGLTQLTAGNLAQGWSGYEHRLGRPNAPRVGLADIPPWRGEAPLAGRSILVHAEQGMGDTLQFVRFLPSLTASGAQVRLVVQPALQGFLAGQLEAGVVWAKGDPLPRFDFQCPLMSLPLALGTTLESIPCAHGPYLRAPVDGAALWKRRLAGRAGPKVGLAWSGNPAHENDGRRSIPLAVFQGILAGTRGDFFGLQVDPRPEDAAVLAGLPQVTDLSPRIRDFRDTAAIVANLDLVITVDTAVAHLAAALGVPTWILVAHAPDWRWMLGREDSPWYPSVRLFRQPGAGDWRSVVGRVRAQLRGLSATEGPDRPRVQSPPPRP